MEKFLHKIGLIQYFSIELDITPEEFAQRLQNIVDIDDFGFFSINFTYSNTLKVYKGIVNLNDFKIKRVRRLYDNRQSNSIATGTVEFINNKSIVNTKVNGFTLTYLFILLIFILTIIGVTIAIIVNFSKVDFTIFLYIGFIFIMFYVVYKQLVQNVKNTIYDLQREFFYLTRKETIY